MDTHWAHQSLATGAAQPYGFAALHLAEERAAGKPRHTLGNGRVFWTKGTISLAEKDDAVAQPKAAPVAVDDSGLPF